MHLILNFLPQILTVLCEIVFFIIYLVGIKRGKVKPVLASRLFFCLAVTLSAITNFQETGIPGLRSNIFNVSDVFLALTLTVFVLFKKDTRRSFHRFEKWCFSAVSAVFVLWLLTNQNVLAHLSIQCILVIAYIPLIIHLWRTGKNTESLPAWTFDLLASVFGLIRPLQTMEFLPLVYGFRSMISVLIVILLILRLKYRMGSEPNHVYRKG